LRLWQNDGVEYFGDNTGSDALTVTINGVEYAATNVFGGSAGPALVAGQTYDYTATGTWTWAGAGANSFDASGTPANPPNPPPPSPGGPGCLVPDAAAHSLVGVFNRAPVPGGEDTETDEDTPVLIDVLANDYDPDGDPLTARVYTQPVGGVVTVSGMQLLFTP